MSSSSASDPRSAKQLKWANKINARKAVIIGTEEMARAEAKVRDMDSGKQEDLPLRAEDLERHLADEA